jgi:hypothetical protein
MGAGANRRRIYQRAEGDVYELGFPHEGIQQRSTLAAVRVMCVPHRHLPLKLRSRYAG